MSKINIFLETTPTKKSRKFWDVFIAIHTFAVVIVLMQTVGSFGLSDGIMVLLMALFIVFFEPYFLAIFIVYLGLSVAISYMLMNISHQKFIKIHCVMWLFLVCVILIWIVGMSVGVFPYNTDHRTYF